MLRARLIYLSELLQRHGFTPSSGALVSSETYAPRTPVSGPACNWWVRGVTDDTYHLPCGRCRASRPNPPAGLWLPARNETAREGHVMKDQTR